MQTPYQEIGKGFFLKTFQKEAKDQVVVGYHQGGSEEVQGTDGGVRRENKEIGKEVGLTSNSREQGSIELTSFM